MTMIRATHYICIKDKPAKGESVGKDKLIIRSGDMRQVNKTDLKLLEDEAAGRFVVVEDEKVEVR